MSHDNDIFQQATERITPAVIEHFLGSHGRWQGDEYWIESPLRSDDKHATNFSINAAKGGQYKDLANGDSGNLITLLVSLGTAQNRVEAAKLIIQASGGTVDETPLKPRKTPAKKTSVAPTITIDDLLYPIPADKENSFDEQVGNYCTNRKNHSWLSEHWYTNEHNELLFVIVRFLNNLKNEKVFSPLFMLKSGALHFKNPIKKDRALYHLYDLASNPRLPVLVVEGEKCADVPVEGYVVVSWVGGAQALKLTDWKPLAHRTVVLWPDHDEPGLKAIQALKNLYLPHASILSIPPSMPKGWDLADAVEENDSFDAAAFVQNSPRMQFEPELLPKDEPKEIGFIPLGYTEDQLIFYILSEKRMFKLQKTGVTAQHLIQLNDSISWWQQKGFKSEKSEINATRALVYLKKLCAAVGPFHNDTHTGAGFYHIGGQFLWHDGTKIINQQGGSQSFESFLPQHVFEYDKPGGDNFYQYSADTVPEKAKGCIIAYFKAREFTFTDGDLSALLMLGWGLWAPFVGFFSWRPSLHLTAEKGTGKSTLVEKAILGLTMPGLIRANLDASPTYLRQKAFRKPRAVMIEEFEDNKKDQYGAKGGVEVFYDLIRTSGADNAAHSGKGSNRVDDNGSPVTLEYFTQLSFLLISVRESTQDAAVVSRIISLELAKKPQLTKEYIALEQASARAIKQYAGAIVSENFKNLAYLIDEVEKFKEALHGEGIDTRVADNMAPLLVFAHFFQHGHNVATCANDVEYYARLINQFIEASAGSKQLSDAETCLDHIMQLDITSSLAPTDSLHQLSRATVHQLLMAVLKEIANNNSQMLPKKLDTVETYIELLHHLGRGGITIFMDGDEPYLAISQGSDLIRAGLKSSSFGSSYASILRRHKKVQATQTYRRCVYVAGVRTRFITFKLFDLFPMEEEN